MYFNLIPYHLDQLKACLSVFKTVLFHADGNVYNPLDANQLNKSNLKKSEAKPDQPAAFRLELSSVPNTVEDLEKMFFDGRNNEIKNRFIEVKTINTVEVPTKKVEKEVINNVNTKK